MSTCHLESQNFRCVNGSESLSVVVGEKSRRKRDPGHQYIGRLVEICGIVRVHRQGSPELIE